jgi:hypothetical protein
MAIEIRDGKFYKDGVEVKPSFGDMEQIRALKDEEAERKKAEEKAKKEKVSDFFKKHTYMIETSLFEASSNENEYQTMLKAYKIIVETIISETK